MAGNYLVNGTANIANITSYQDDECAASTGPTKYTPIAIQQGGNEVANLATAGALHAGPTSPVTLRCETSDSASLVDGGVTGALVSTLNGAADNPAATHARTLKQEFRKLEAKTKAASRSFKK